MAVVHFWTLRGEAQRSWDPDVEPERNLSGFGHAFLELYWRLRREGRQVSIGPKVPHSCDAVVVSLEEPSEWLPRLPPRMAARLALACLRPIRTPAVAMLRVDVPLEIQSPRYTTLELMPTQAAVEQRNQAYLPMFPHRGLLPRDSRRGDTLDTIALKAYSYNIPEWLDESFEQEVRTLGYRMRVDTEHDGRWRDFRDVDVILCTHPPTTVGDDRRKPPTKLINAWRAGAIPICGSYSGYLEIGRPGEDMLVTDNTPAQYLEALAELRQAPALASRIRERLPERARDYEPANVADAYWQAFSHARRANRFEILGEFVRATGSRVRQKVARMVRR